MTADPQKNTFVAKTKNKTTMNKFHAPNDGDVPLQDLQDKANEALLSLPPGTIVHFTFTCKYCGERNVFEEANSLYESGECCTCGKETFLFFGGFLVMIPTQQLA